MPIAKYFLQNLPPAPSPPIPPDSPNQFTGGGNWIENELLSIELWEKTKRFEKSLTAWELGETDYIPGKQVKFDQFAWKVYLNTKVNSNMMGEVVKTIEDNHESQRIEKLIKAAKYTALTSTAAYIIYRLMFLKGF